MNTHNTLRPYEIHCTITWIQDNIEICSPGTLLTVSRSAVQGTWRDVLRAIYALARGTYDKPYITDAANPSDDWDP